MHKGGLIMPFKHLEHEGDEDIKDNENFSNRTKTRIKGIKDKAVLDKAEIDAKIKAQEEWLSVNNPMIFDGDIDA